MDIILEAVKKSSEPLETDLNKKKNLTFSYKKPNLKTIASSNISYQARLEFLLCS